jgi:hypothetical protein
MKGKWQFSLSYLSLEVFWIMLAIGLVRLIICGFPIDSEVFVAVRISIVPATLASCGAAIGGLFGNMRLGAIWGGMILGFLLFFLLLPSIRT